MAPINPTRQFKHQKRPTFNDLVNGKIIVPDAYCVPGGIHYIDVDPSCDSDYGDIVLYDGESYKHILIIYHDAINQEDVYSTMESFITQLHQAMNQAKYVTEQACLVLRSLIKNIPTLRKR